MTANTSARADILANIRRSLDVREDDATRRRIVDERIAHARPGIQPARGHGDLEARIETFIAQAEGVSASVARVSGEAAIAPEAARFLRSHNLPMTLRCGEEPRFAGLDWEAQSISVSRGPSEGDDLNAISHAEHGIAETGTLVLVSGAHNPTSLNFLPDNHIVVLRTQDLHATCEEALTLVRARYGKGVLPRTVNFITGPSRSADIEQKLLLGAHGPRRLHIILVDIAG